MIQAVTSTKIQAINTGTTMARIEITVETRSSAMLTGTLPAPPVVAVTAGLTARDLTALTPPETSSPSPSDSTGCTSVITSALAANTTAPAAGRTKAWMMSLMWLTAGTLSAKNSMRDRTNSSPMIHQEVSTSQG